MAIERRIDLIDMEWSHDGDFVVRNGDLSDTSGTTGQGFIQEAQDRIKSSLDDWKINPNRGANLEDYEGEINNEQTWLALENTIAFSFTRDGFLDSQDFVVTAAPLSNSEVAIRVDFNTSLTNVSVNSKIVVKVVYDLRGQGPFILR